MSFRVEHHSTELRPLSGTNKKYAHFGVSARKPRHRIRLLDHGGIKHRSTVGASSHEEHVIGRDETGTTVVHHDRLLRCWRWAFHEPTSDQELLPQREILQSQGAVALEELSANAVCG